MAGTATRFLITTLVLGAIGVALIWLAIRRKRAARSGWAPTAECWAAYAVAKETVERLALQGYVAAGTMCEGGATVMIFKQGSGLGKRVFISEEDASADHRGSVERALRLVFDAEA